MPKKKIAYDKGDTIAAISTPAGAGGIGIVRLSGKKALAITDKIFLPKDKSKPSDYKTYTTHYGHIVRNPSVVGRRSYVVTTYDIRHTTYEIVDEVILTVMRAPKSYTKEDIVEINCHGGIVCLRKVLDLTLKCGARLAEPGEFTKRAFLNGRIDLAQAEAVGDIISSKTESAMKVALEQLEGGLSKAIRRYRETLINALGEIEARIDFPEEDLGLKQNKEISRKLEKLSSEIKKLIEDAWKGMIVKEGILCVICGKPNVGKSSLMNALLRRNRVIVTPVPGTTRDAIEEEISLNGMPVRVVDTAGISDAKGTVQRHGVRKSRHYINRADLILFMVDLSRPSSGADKEIFNSIKDKKFIVIANKIDLPRRMNIKKMFKKNVLENALIEVSILKRKNLGSIEERISEKIWHGEILHPEASFVTNLRQKSDLENAYKAIRKAEMYLNNERTGYPEIVASELREAIFHMGSILGDNIEPDILGKIFSKFCIGK